MIRFPSVLLCLFAGILLPASSLIGADGTIFGVQSRRSSTLFPLFLHINDDSTIANPGSALFGLTDRIGGAAFKDGVFYGVQRQIGFLENYLVTIAHIGPALGARVGASDIGFPKVEGLANVGGRLLAVSVDDTLRTTSLISIDCRSGVGTLIGTGPTNVIIVGLAYDPETEMLYGAGTPSGSGEGAVDDPNLYTINPDTGAMTLVGNLGTTIQGLAWTKDLGLIGAFDHLYQIDASTGLASQIGETDYTDGRGVGEGILNGVYALAGIVTGDSSSFSITSISREGSGDVTLTWDSDECSRYQVQRSLAMADGKWSAVSDVRPGEMGSMSFMYPGTAESESGFFRVLRFTP